MKISVSETPQEVEKEFNRIKSEMHQYLLSQDFKIPPDQLFNSLDGEFEIVKQKYVKQNDRKNLLHASHNYHWLSLFRYLDSDPTKSLEMFMEALLILLERHNHSRYQNHAFENMLKTYQMAVIKIGEKSKNIKFEKIIDKLEKFIERVSQRYVEFLSKFPEVFNILCNVFVDYYDNEINSMKIKSSNIDESEKIKGKIERILDFIEKAQLFRSKTFVPSKCYEALYKLKKKQLHFFVMFIFFEKDEGKKKKAQDFVDQITKEMLSYADSSMRFCKKYVSKMPPEHRDNEKVKLMIALKEIDLFTSQFYDKAYSKKDIFQAWKQIDKIRYFLVQKYFGENIKLSKGLLDYFAEEWALLDIFAKANLFRIEVIRRKELLNQEWENEIFQSIIDSMDIINNLFRYELTDDKNYQLKIMSAQFSGGFSEYFIHDIFEDYFINGIIDENSPPQFSELMKLIKEVRKEDIIRNDFIEKDKPDIDIHIKKKCAVFLKNANIDRGDLNQMRREIDLCNKNKIKKVFYAINFVKNLRNIENIHFFFENIGKEYSDIQIRVVDIKDMVEAFLNELKRSGKSKLNFSELDLYKIIDY